MPAIMISTPAAMITLFFMVMRTSPRPAAADGMPRWCHGRNGRGVSHVQSLTGRPAGNERVIQFRAVLATCGYRRASSDASARILGEQAGRQRDFPPDPGPGVRPAD